MKAKGVALAVVALVLAIPCAFFVASIWVGGGTDAAHLASTGAVIFAWLVLTGFAGFAIYGP